MKRSPIKRASPSLLAARLAMAGTVLWLGAAMMGPATSWAGEAQPSVAAEPEGESAAAAPAPAARRPASRQDPLESFNRAVFSFNDAVDAALLEPVARAYRDAVPALVRQGVRNVFGNVEDGWSAINHVLQGKGQAGYEMMVRFVTNTTFGLGGLLDVAGEMGLERRSEDFGQTLGRWGLPAGPYVVLPLLGPSSVRDGVARPLDRAAALPNVAAEGSRSWALSAVDVVHTRSELLATGALLNQVALDKYTFVRDAYLARRRSLVYDGNPPPEPEDGEPQGRAEPVGRR
ncbi:MAG: hypothetical protein RI988_1827 [Pseudomonadota bacterium]|jgi:phospholipid-binding lipoprotein MlaA